MAPVTLPEVLAAKENRARLREEIRQTQGLPVLTFSINCPGTEKNSISVRKLLRHAVDIFHNLAAAREIAIQEERIFYPSTGPFALMAADAETSLLKKLAVQIEDLPDYGRLLDVDVYDAAGRQWSRTDFILPLRSCFLCDNTAITCMREKRHTGEEIGLEFQRRLALFNVRNNTHCSSETREIGQSATEAMLMEAACTPAPGLVDRINSGAHRDMDFFTFMKSTSALADTMTHCAIAGWNHNGPPAALWPVLRSIGREGERRMFQSTQGVNTQKGLIFLMGLLCAATARIRRRSDLPTAESICREVAGLCDGMVSRELEPLLTQEPLGPLTAGERLYVNHRVTGIRGEVEKGLPSALEHGLPCLRQAMAGGLSLNDALVHTLMTLMTVVEDTTILHRHDPATLLYVQEQARCNLSLGGMFTEAGRADVKRLDAEFIRRWISPGGVADLLAAVYFLHRTEIGDRALSDVTLNPEFASISVRPPATEDIHRC